MFWLLRTLISVAILGVIAAGVIYFLPYETKVNVVGKIAGVLPESIKDQTEEFFFTPAEAREKILADLKANFEELKEATPAQVKKIADESEALLEKLKEKNEEQSLPELARQKILDFFVREKIECKPEN